MELSELGLSQGQLQELVVDKIVQQLLYRGEEDDEGYACRSDFHKELRSKIKEKAISTVAELAKKYVLPVVQEDIKALLIEKTNNYGEKKGETTTFVEYMVERAKAYMADEVDNVGRSRAECSSWRGGNQKRLVYLLNKHLSDAIEQVIKTVLKDANDLLAEGVEETVKLKLVEIKDKFSVKVKA